MYRLAWCVLAVFISFASVPARALPPVWQVSGGESPVYVFGGLHMLKNGTAWMDDTLRDRILSADGVLMEISEEEMSPKVTLPLLLKYGFLLEKDDCLKKHLPAALYDDLAARMAEQGTPKEALVRFRPWLAAQMLSTQALIRLGYRVENGTEATLLALAKAHRIKVSGLETAEDQMILFSEMTEAQGIRSVRHELDELPTLKTKMPQFVAAWMDGDLVALARLSREDALGLGRLQGKLVGERNRKWAQTISQGILRRPGTYFVAVGMGHLVGEDSLLRLLADAGADVKRLR